MQILLTVVILLGLVVLGALFIARVNAQQAGRLATHKYASLLPSFRVRMRKWPHGGGAHPGAHAGGPPPRAPQPGGSGADVPEAGDDGR
ncbi:hypothetical protein ACWIG3_13665 [Streptomyces celluloflavus]|uniref:Uncharacterized protein n=2 Tax=Streptomyces TaxID=1883 RepID=A0A4Q9HWM4_STRKA|nr:MULTISPECIES: hypothetical protein [Streptomyces]MYU53489.1 hypothetical protein [Streptomyces sp. SID7805]TBO58670.1 hypothetical protein EYS09_16240 [Streptomyces kasugaensis]WSK13868.1 hypothetical protein OG717_20130 [Streptomyces celluloflavus]